ncbi:hypothetical protein O181_009998 [Austropuccinia psidii MF-1]|uniref:Uncharacterized protein n=1 Tax=Austropuccinia psidii MF-1 TaxID=1389203 RepID=A0A9Q3BS46_9BASI|nr:hypothetical protein [Austropuccinia psidii MF-1]
MSYSIQRHLQLLSLKLRTFIAPKFISLVQLIPIETAHFELVTLGRKLCYWVPSPKLNYEQTIVRIVV